MSFALDEAGDQAAGAAQKELDAIKDKMTNSLEAGKDDGEADAAVEAVKEEEDTGDPPDVDDELPGPFYTQAWFLALSLFSLAGVTSFVVWQAAQLNKDAKPPEDELDQYAHDPRAPVAPAKGKGKGKGKGAEAAAS
ncbi:unnamed protein product [Effrenium voratum]|uniref:Uncharacterized protein n=1 Tax=Effrenium voratum TaxID=2562239 RepID=A0AA36J0E8_9DINO|nr:unnamed protein product [Effrenium voratum]